MTYSTKYGSTGRIAEHIAKSMKDIGIDAVQAEVSTVQKSDVPTYDLVIVGSPIFMGKWTKPTLRFLEENQQALGSKKTALFVCCGDAIDPNRINDARKNYLDEVAASYKGIAPLSLGLFPGVIDFNQYGFLIKSLMKGQARARGIEDVDTTKTYDFIDFKLVDGWTAELLKKILE